MSGPRKTRRIPIFKRPFKFLFNWRPFPLYELVSYVLMYASVPMLAYGIQTYNLSTIKIIILTILTLYSGFFAALIWNDITDKDIDAIVHPNRPLPNGSISSKKFFSIALVFSVMTFVFSLLINFWCFVLVITAALFVTFHNKYLKKIVKIPAYSEIFTPLQWIIVPIFGFLAISGFNFQQIALIVIFTYFADNAHDLAEGIHDIEGDLKNNVRTYATSFGEKTASKVSFGMFFISGFLGILLYIKTILSPIFLISFIILWLYMLFNSYKLVKAEKTNMKKLGEIIGRKGFDYFLMSYNLIFIDILMQLILHRFNLAF